MNHLRDQATLHELLHELLFQTDWSPMLIVGKQQLKLALLFFLLLLFSMFVLSHFVWEWQVQRQFRRLRATAPAAMVKQD